mmetsp:Transcript_70422/g.143024  ORF Transcript_70422/g.143024 Transcript_70422/m.143024 type:complete len:189 (-) Transcript_70422:223-789(-)
MLAKASFARAARQIASRSIVSVGSQMKGTKISLQAGRSWDAGVADNFAKTSLDTLFGGKKVVLFALPGAYTGVCETGHVPSFIKNAAAFKAKGVDTIACVSVNDPYTMHAWAKSMGAADDIAFFGDSDGSFTEFVGQALDLNVAGLGPAKRSNRYSMLVEDGVVKEMKIEEGAGDLKVSDGDTMLAAL